MERGDAGRALSGRWAVAVSGGDLAADVAAAREAEAFGAEAALAGDRDLDPDAFVVSAAVLAATTSLRAGPGIVNVAERHPAGIARGAAGLDAVAPGRALLGVGRGSPEYLAELGLGADAASLEDALAILAAALAGEAVDHAGRRWSARMPAGRRVAVPLMLAAVGRRTLRLAGERADAVLLNYGASPEYVAGAVATVRAAAEAAGRPPGVPEIWGLVHVCRTDTEGASARLERLAREVAALYALGAQGRALAAGLDEAPTVWDVEALARVAAVGDLDECAAFIDRLRAAGLQVPVLLPSGMRALAAG